MTGEDSARRLGRQGLGRQGLGQRGLGQRGLGQLGLPLSLIASVLAGAAFTLVHAAVAHRSPAERSSSYRGFCAPPELLPRDRHIYAPGSCLVQVDDDGWRPLQLEVRLRLREQEPPQSAAGQSSPSQSAASLPAPSRTTEAVSVQISVNDHPVARVDLARTGWTTRVVDLPRRDRLATALLLRVETSTPIGDGTPPIEVGPVDVTRVWTRGRTLGTAAAGALAGAIAWALIVPPLSARRRERADPLSPPAPLSPFAEKGIAKGGKGGGEEKGDAVPLRVAGQEPASPVAGPDLREEGREQRQGSGPARAPRRDPRPRGWRAVGGVALGLTVYFAAWALLRPPYQTPDEVQHHLRATAVVRHPWLAGAGEWTLDPRFTNPLAHWPPPSLDKLFFARNQRLTRQELAAIKAVPWPAPDSRPIPEPYRRAIASYPTLYYVAVFAVAEPITRALSLSPYQSTYAYRLVSGCLAALLWAAVYRVLRRTDATRDLAGTLVAFLVLNPMVAFMSSAINPDAVNVPLATLAVLLLWRVLSAGANTTAAFLALVATAWTKPSGLQLLAAFVLTASVLWACRRVSLARLRLAGAIIAAAGVVVWCGFYAWSPPRFVGGPPVPDTLTTYLDVRWRDLWHTWVQYWGTLGWLEYALAAPWYVALLALSAISVAFVVMRPIRRDGFALYCAGFVAAFIAITLAGEFAYLPTAGYFLQGRHLLPASIGLALLMLHRVRVVRLAFLALLLTINLLLLDQTVRRYYTRGWSTTSLALPFER